MKRDLRGLADEQFDVLVIGGGIVGAGVARDAALRGLRGAIRFYDCQEDDARFCVENILHAADLGAACANYCELSGFVMRGDRPLAARVVDRLGGGGKLEIRAKLFVNAAGPWVEQV